MIKIINIYLTPYDNVKKYLTRYSAQKSMKNCRGRTNSF